MWEDFEIGYHKNENVFLGSGGWNIIPFMCSDIAVFVNSYE